MSTNSEQNHTADAREIAPASTAAAGYLSEMFCSVQGEGLFVGERQIFVRTAGCAATCSWCDTVYSKVQTPRFVVHGEGETPARWRANPVALEEVLDDVVACARANAPVVTVSVTGGEPLEQPEFVAALSRGLRERGFRVYLETAGIHPDALHTVVDHVDVIAMDIKLPSATGVAHWDAHREFFSVLRGSEFDPARGARACFVKVIVDLKATVAEIERAAELVASFSPRVPFVLQPESETMLSKNATRENRRALLELIDLAARAASLRLDSVRVIPQTHKVLNVR
ncbi:MAG TPA: 7-carboxy-7-deazaguanine synthase QueE [Candidatus Krumholzibacteria bacterium]|nr:7-carboxy-7-deazaguanine synthase QueE [Candidatus Krumholzibacteria bacterium]